MREETVEHFPDLLGVVQPRPYDGHGVRSYEDVGRKLQEQLPRRLAADLAVRGGPEGVEEADCKGRTSGVIVPSRHFARPPDGDTDEAHKEGEGQAGESASSLECDQPLLPAGDKQGSRSCALCQGPEDTLKITKKVSGHVVHTLYLCFDVTHGPGQVG